MSPSSPGLYRKKPVVIEAIQYTGGNIGDIRVWSGDADILGPVYNDENAYVYTPEGRMRCRPGDWIIRGVFGEFYPVAEDIFAETYEGVPE